MEAQQQLANLRDFSWSFWYTLPIYPFGKRQTIRKEVVKDTVWTFDQIQGIFYVVVPIRMTVVKLREGGLLVYAPIAPTPECIRLITELVKKYQKNIKIENDIISNVVIALLLFFK